MLGSAPVHDGGRLPPQTSVSREAERRLLRLRSWQKQLCKEFIPIPYLGSFYSNIKRAGRQLKRGSSREGRSWLELRVN